MTCLATTLHDGPRECDRHLRVIRVAPPPPVVRLHGDQPLWEGLRNVCRGGGLWHAGFGAAAGSLLKQLLRQGRRIPAASLPSTAAPRASPHITPTRQPTAFCSMLTGAARSAACAITRAAAAASMMDAGAGGRGEPLAACHPAACAPFPLVLCCAQAGHSPRLTRSTSHAPSARCCLRGCSSSNNKSSRAHEHPGAASDKLRWLGRWLLPFAHCCAQHTQ